jgi:hypothetical protein
MNYQNREVFQARCAIRDTGLMTGTYFQIEIFYKNDNFICFEGKFDSVFERLSKALFIKSLEKIYGEGNIYLSDKEKDMKLLKINREAALNRTYQDFISEK